MGIEIEDQEDRLRAWLKEAEAARDAAIARLDARQTELIEANNRMLERARSAEAEITRLRAENERLTRGQDKLLKDKLAIQEKLIDTNNILMQRNDEITNLREALRVAREALSLFEDSDSWEREGRCDPCSGNFIGSTHARAALTCIDQLIREKSND